MNADGESITLRPATASDRDSVLAWRNHPEIRRASFDDRPIDADRHAEWFAAALDDESRILLIGEQDGLPIGFLRYDCEGDVATLSAFLAPERIGSGLGSRLMAAGTRWIADHRPQVRRIEAHLRAGNDRSLRALRRAGFSGEGEILRCEVGDTQAPARAVPGSNEAGGSGR
jgi:UDP-2,4-diacetamido-2,4,6-trideoxy-beta-L-altropyranose hydrolase